LLDRIDGDADDGEPASPAGAAEQAEPGEHEHAAPQEREPAPCGRVEDREALGGRHDVFVLDDRGETLKHVHYADDDDHEPGEDDPPGPSVL
jgi:hypothetical protein